LGNLEARGVQAPGRNRGRESLEGRTFREKKSKKLGASRGGNIRRSPEGLWHQGPEYFGEKRARGGKKCLS